MTQSFQEYSPSTSQVSTTVEIYTNRFKQLEWIFAEAFNVLAATFVSWIAFSLIVYGKQTGKWSEENRLNATKVDVGVVFTLAIFTTICSFIRLATNQAAFNFGYTDRSSLRCEVGTAISYICSTLTMLGFYMFVWFRQRSLYRHPSMEELKKRWLKMLSYMISIYLLLGGLFILACMLITCVSSPQAKAVSKVHVLVNYLFGLATFSFFSKCLVKCSCCLSFYIHFI